MNNSFKITIKNFLDLIDWRDSYKDLYPDFSSPEDQNQYEEDYRFNTKEDAVGFAKETISLFNSLPNPIPIFRAIHAKSKDDISLEYPEESWSYRKESALNFAGNQNMGNFLLSGTIDKRFVDWERTLKNYIDFSGGFSSEDEDEITIGDETKIKILSIDPIQKRIRENVAIKKVKDQFYQSYHILDNKVKIGEINGYKKGNIMNVESIYIDPNYRGKGFGYKALKLFKNKCDCQYITADCVSQQSFFTFVKAFGEPEYFGNIFDEFSSFEQVKDYLPKTAHEDEDGTIIAGTESAVFVRFKK
jgi:hypothetical protein